MTPTELNKKHRLATACLRDHAAIGRPDDEQADAMHTMLPLYEDAVKLLGLLETIVGGSATQSVLAEAYDLVDSHRKRFKSDKSDNKPKKDEDHD